MKKMRYLLVFALLLFAAPAAAQNYLSPEQCMQSAQFFDELVAERDSIPYSQSAKYREKQEFIKEYADKHTRLCIMPYWCDDADQANAKTNVKQMEAMNRYCAHKQQEQQQSAAPDWGQCQELAMMLDIVEVECGREGEKNPACSEQAKNEEIFTTHCILNYACAPATAEWKKADGFISYAFLMEKHCDADSK